MQIVDENRDAHFAVKIIAPATNSISIGWYREVPLPIDQDHAAIAVNLQGWRDCAADRRDKMTAMRPQKNKSAFRRVACGE